MKIEKRKGKWLISTVLLWLAFAPLAQAFYNPSTGRWLNRDPAGERTSDGPNVNAFARNNPIDRFDTDGKESWGPPFFPPQPPPSPGSGKTLFYWAPTPCANGNITAFIQVGLGGSTFYPKPFVDDGTHGLFSANPRCPPLYPASQGGTFADEPGSALGTVGLNGLKFEVCRVCLANCCNSVQSGRLKGTHAGLTIVSIGPCMTYTLPGSGKDTDLGAPGGGTSNDSPSDGFTDALNTAYPKVNGGVPGCFKCSSQNQSGL